MTTVFRTFYILLMFVAIIHAENAFIPEFQVNENAGPYGAFQKYPAIDSDSLGNFIIVWEDGRRGGSSLFVQKYSANGQLLDENKDLKESGSNPAVLLFDNGQFVIVWCDKSEYPKVDIYFRIYSNDCTPYNSGARINTISGSGSRGAAPHISSDKNGNFIVTWHDERDGSSMLYAQRFDKSGELIDTNFRVNEEGTSYSGGCTAFNSNGDFIITWSDNRTGDFLIFTQKYSNSGEISGNNILINDTDTYSSNPSIACDYKNNFIIVWESGDGWMEDVNVIAQRLNNNGEKTGTNFVINSGTGVRTAPKLVATEDNHYFVVWYLTDSNYLEYNIFAQQFANTDSKIGSVFQINDVDSTVKNLGRQNVTSDSKGNFILTWSDDRQYDENIYAQRYDQSGNRKQNNFMVNDDTGSSDQKNPQIAVDGYGNFIVSWEDDRNGDYDIYVQKYNSQGQLLGVNFKVNAENSMWLKHRIAVLDDGTFIVIWQKSSLKNFILDYDIWGQIYSFDGMPIGDNFRVSDDIITSDALQSDPSVSVMDQDHFIITWGDSRNDNVDIYGQIYARDGKKVGANIKINDDMSGSWQNFPKVAGNKDNGFLVVWWDERNVTSRDLYAQKFSSNGNKIGDNFKVNNSQLGYSNSFWGVEIAMDNYGNCILLWEKSNKIFFRKYQSDGQFAGAESSLMDYYSCSVAYDQNKFLIVYNDVDGLWGQRFSDDGTLFENKFKVAQTMSNNPAGPDVKLFNDQIYNTWCYQLSKNTGSDIWANVLDFNNPYTFIGKNDNLMAEDYCLYQNHPNPFNNTTNISYDIKKSSFVVLKIYNIQGQEIQTLVDQYQNSGSYQIKFDASFLPSGIYVYQLETDNFTRTKRLLLIK